MGYTLKEIIQEYLIENGDSNFNKFARYLQFGISFLREINMDVSGSPTEAILPINSNSTANLPIDYINYTRVGILDANGQIRDLGINSNLLSTIARDSCGNSVLPSKPNTPQGLDTITDSFTATWDSLGDNYRNSELMGRFFGIGGGNNANGYYNIKRSDGIIVLSNVMGTQIVLEYISDIKQIDGNFQVHPFFIEALKNWMYWKSIKMDSNKNLGEKQLSKKDYDISYRQAIRRFSSANISDWLQTFRKGNMAAPKW